MPDARKVIVRRITAPSPAAEKAKRAKLNREERLSAMLGQLRASLVSYENLMKVCYSFYESFSRTDSNLLTPQELQALHRRALKRLELALLGKENLGGGTAVSPGKEPS